MQLRSKDCSAGCCDGDPARLRQAGIVRDDGAGVGRIVVALQELGHQRLPIAGMRHLLPPLDRRVAVQLHQAVELPAQGEAGSARKCAYSSISRRTRVVRSTSSCTHGLAHIASSNSCGTCSTPIFLLSDSTYTGRAGSRAAQALPQQALEHLLSGLRRVRQVAQYRPAVGGQPLEVEHLRAEVLQRGQQPALAGTGEAAQHPTAQAPRKRGKLG